MSKLIKRRHYPLKLVLILKHSESRLSPPMSRWAWHRWLDRVVSRQSREGVATHRTPT